MRASRREFLTISAAALISSARPATTWAATGGAATPVWQQFKADARRTGRTARRGPLDPQRLWDAAQPSIQSSMSVGADGTIYLAGDSGVLNAYEPSGERRWARRVANTYVTAGTAILDDASILVVPETGLAVCYSRLGIRRWTFDLADYSGPASAPLIASDGTIYLGNQTGLYAVRRDGSHTWLLAETVSGPPAEGLDGTIYFPSDSRLVAVSPDGVRLWGHPSGFSYGLGSAPAVGDDGTIYVTGVRGQLLAVNPDGTRRWVAGDEGLVSDVPSSPAIGHDGTIYFGSSYTYFNAVYPDGSLKWSRLTIDGDSYSAPTVGGDGTIYVGAATGKVHAFTPDGDPIWERFFGNFDRYYYVRSEPVIMREGLLLVGAYDGVFVVAD